MKLGVGLAGLGRIGRMHAANLATRCADAELACVYDVDAAAAAAVAKDLGVPWTASFDELLDAVGAVAIATSTASHSDLTIAAAAAGKHVFCEKPISLDRTATLATLDAVERAGVVFQVGFHRRFDRDWAAAAERIQAGDLGDVRFFRSSLRDMTPPDPAFLAGSGGFFADVTVHDLDVARWLVGEVVEVSAHGGAEPAFAELGQLDTAVVVLRFANGALGVIDNSRSARYGFECSTEVVGTRAAVRIDAPHRDGVEWRSGGVSSRTMTTTFAERNPRAFVDELDAFARAVRDGTPPRVTGRDGLAASDLAAAAQRAWETGRTVPVTPSDEKAA